MIQAQDFLEAARERGLDFFTGVPCSFLTPLINRVISDPATEYVGATSEGEAVAIAGMPVGELSSVGWSDRAGVCVGLGYVRGDMALQAHAGTPVSVDLWGRAVGATAWDRWVAPSH